MTEIIVLSLFAAYLLAEVTPLARRPRSWVDVSLTGLLTGLLAYLLLGVWQAWMAFVLMVAVGMLSGATRTWRHVSGARWLSFHGAVLVILFVSGAAWVSPMLGDVTSWWEGVLPVTYRTVLVLVVGLVVTVPLGGDFVSVIIRPYAEQLEDDGLGLTRGGRIIGNTERLLIFVFVLANAPAAIGFLVAAKSIFRFGEVTGDEHRKQAEYVIIGTLVSFAYAVVTSYVVQLVFLEMV